MTSPWHFGNTTVRNPNRIREGLIALQNSTLSGNLNGRQQELMFADVLEASQIVLIKNKDRDYSDLGRKWRSCFSQLGFITHKFKRSLSSGEADPKIKEIVLAHSELDLSGLPYQITPSGQRMIEAETVQEQQECMLRALLSYEIPSVIEPRKVETSFQPFVFILQILKALSISENSLGLSKVEMGIVQSYKDHSKVNEVVHEIIKYRNIRNKTKGRVPKRRLDNELLDRLGDTGGVQRQTVKDYADVNFRYARSTGLVSYKGTRLVINKKKLPVVNAILDEWPRLIGGDNENKYLIRLWKGSSLPTDNKHTVIKEIKRFRNLLIESGLNPEDIPYISFSDSDLSRLNQNRIRLEVMYQQVIENEYAVKQSNIEHVKETIAYLKKLDKQSYNQELYDIDIDDEPAYLEWAIWRAFLAINNLVNEPHEARRFSVDQDFFPISCAPGGGPDLIFEFEDYVLVVEVTLTVSSRQEAAEGEPVRRHVAREQERIASATGKPVYGLFIARSIDNNTAETFRIGIWYKGDEPEFINIVPITLGQFILMMEKYASVRFDEKVFRRILDSCLIPRNAHAPAWKKEIDRIITEFIH